MAKKRHAEATGGPGSSREVETLLDALVAGKPDPSNAWYPPKLKEYKAGQAILALGRDRAAMLVRALVARLREADKSIIAEQNTPGKEPGAWTPLLLQKQYEKSRYLSVLNALLRRKLPLGDEDIRDLITAFRGGPEYAVYYFPILPLVRTIELFAKGGGPMEKVDREVKWLRQWLSRRGTPRFLQPMERLDRARGVQPG